ncbi:15387_t:CDS:2 [Dentiscutata heterogama]|uniref:15387_t:CDS:1 n=1 Tax=Dentiscutata heterogama TaxID=1316150 RepID=A0ACA9MLZ6_9GLOM|nr:15387_t:CDS:2 [Dentiscutata heterogama]
MSGYKNASSSNEKLINDLFKNASSEEELALSFEEVLEEELFVLYQFVEQQQKNNANFLSSDLTMFQLFPKRSIRSDNTELKRLKRKRYEQIRHARINDSLKKLKDYLSIYKMSKVEILKEGKHSFL